MVVLGGARSDDSGEFIQRRRDHKMTVSGLDAELVVPATQVLGEVTWAAEASETRVTSSVERHRSSRGSMLGRGTLCGRRR